MRPLDKMLLPQRQHETMHQKPREVLDVGEVMLDFNGILHFPQGQRATAFYLLQESGWLWAQIPGSRLFFSFIPPLEILLFAFISRYDKENSVFTILASLESGPVTELAMYLGQVKYFMTLSIHICFLPPFAQAVLSASNALPCLANLTDFNSSF